MTAAFLFLLVLLCNMLVVPVAVPGDACIVISLEAGAAATFDVS